MSILNVDKIQPIGGGSTITVDATDIQASTGTVRASTFSGDVSATGIGVTSLNVAGVTTFTGAVTSSSAITAHDYRSGGGVGNTLYLTSADDWRFRTTGGNERLRIKSDGKIGLGVNATNPSFQLQIHESVNTAYAANATVAQLAIGNVNSSSATNAAGIHLFTDGNGRGLVNLSALNNSTSSSADFAIQTRHSATIAERLRITSSGSVNIGGDYTQTTYKLRVSGTSYLGGVVRVPNGSAAAPAIHFGDSDSGLYGDSSNGVRLTAGGSDKIVATTNGVTFPIKATALTSFTLGSQSALSKPLYFADAASVESASILLDNTSQELRIKNGRYSGQITFTTYNTERLRIDSSGHLKPATNDTYNLGTSSLKWANVYIDNYVYVGTTGSSFKDNQLLFKSSGTAFIDHFTTGQDIQFRTSVNSALDTSSVKVTSAGNVAFMSGRGIDFSAASSLISGRGTSTSHILDDYEEGDYTPTFTVQSGSVTLDSNQKTLIYTKIGRQVTIIGSIKIASVNNPSGIFRAPLPFGRANNTEQSERTMGNIMVTGAAVNNANEFATYPDGGVDSHLEIVSISGTTIVRNGGQNMQANAVIYVNYTYFTY